MINLIKINPSRLLQSLSVEEISLFVAMGTLINDIMMGHKLMAAYANRYANEDEDRINTYQGIALTIEQIGRLYEAKNTLSQAFAHPELKKKYLEELSVQGRECKENFFATVKSNQFRLVRNDISNHLKFGRIVDIVAANFSQIDEIVIYLGQDWSLTRFLIADQLRSFAVLKIFGCANINDLKEVNAVLTKIILTLATCTLYLQEYFNEVMNKMLEHLGADAINLSPVENVPTIKLSELRIPFFVLKDAELSRPEANEE